MLNNTSDYQKIKEQILQGVQEANYEARQQQATNEQKRANQRVTRLLKDEIEERLKTEDDFVIELNAEQFEALNDSYQKGDKNNFEYLKNDFYNHHRRVAKVELGGQMQGHDDDELSFNKAIHVKRI